MFARQAIVAGSYYSADVSLLKKQLDNFFLQKSLLADSFGLKILIVPHAGFQYSGQVAASGFAKINKEIIKKVIILGVSHAVYFEGVAVWGSGNWQTPLGEVEIDHFLAKKIINKKDIFTDTKIHLMEQTQEVQLPFLQYLLEDFQIVPVLIGNAGNNTLKRLALNIAQNLDQQTLLLVSSDLSHYPEQKQANSLDKEIIRIILANNLEKFAEILNKGLSDQVQTRACGAQAIKVALEVAALKKYNKVKLFDYQNSGDITGEKQKVVGYASLGFFQDELLTIARKSLTNFLTNGKISNFKSTKNQNKNGVFVTLYQDGKLRGCLGNFQSPLSLKELVAQTTIESAVNDPRFPPLDLEDLGTIRIEISVLSGLKKIKHWQDIKLGKHGVLIKNNGASATFLPQVARETEWSLEEFMQHLCSDKAGLCPDCYLDPQTEIFVYNVKLFAE